MLGYTLLTSMFFIAGAAQARDIVHDAEFYVLEAQHSEKWATEDKAINKKLAALEEKFGQPPNLIHIMWDDTAFGDVGIPQIQQVRGFKTPRLNQLASEGIFFSREIILDYNSKTI